MAKKITHIQIYKGFEIRSVYEDNGYSIYLSTTDKNLEPLYSLLIIKNASNCAKAIKKAQELIDQANEIDWEFISQYAPFEIYTSKGFCGWMYKITKQGEIIKIENNFDDKYNVIQYAFIVADKEWQKLFKK